MMNLLPEEPKEERKRRSRKVVYIGKGTTLRDIPARDFTIEEWEKYPMARRRHAIKLGLYKEM